MIFLNSQDGVEIFLNVCFIAIFIGFFYFTYGIFMEKKILENQINYNVNEVKDLANKVNTNIMKFIVENIGKHEISGDMKDADKKVEESNKKIRIPVLVVISVLLVATIIIFFMLTHFLKIGVKEPLISCGAILFFVAITETAFLTFVGNNYITLDPNYIKYITGDEFLKKIEDSVNKKEK